MPTIDISSETLELLKRLAVPFVDTTPESVIARLATDALEAEEAPRVGSGRVRPPDLVEVDPHFAGNLAFTRVRRARFGAQEVEPPKWNQLLRVAHLQARKVLGSVQALADATSARVRAGAYSGEGFRPVPGGDFSLQGLDSNLAWASSLRLAKKLNRPIEVEFEWLDKEAAAHPGKRGHLIWEPESG
jgi:hypothetical protein